jgi:pimeloyl-ACP methyl ester carboxylesterase
MRIALIFIFAVLTSAGFGAQVDGHWKGTLHVAQGIDLHLALEVERNPNGTFTATLISIDQGNTSIPASSVKQDGDAVEIKWDPIKSTFTGTLAKDGKTMRGTWNQSRPLPITFERTEKAFALNRPQEPKKPYPYSEQEVQVASSDGVKLAGTLTLPRGAGPFPAVVLITGSGPQDRDEAILGHRPFLVLADYLTRNGIAVLRCDDRGVAKSTGVYVDAKLGDFTNDALACADFLHARKEIGPKHIGLIGHSEGATIATEAAARAPDKIAFVVMLAGPGVPMVQLLKRQTHDLNHAAGVDGTTLKLCDAFESNLLDAAIKDADSATLEKNLREIYLNGLKQFTPAQQTALGLSAKDMDQRLSFLVSPLVRELLRYDPTPTLKRVRCPVLALDGEKDLQVAADENLPAIRAALKAGGNANVTTMALANLNHLFQHCKTGAVGEYSTIEETFAPEAMKIVSDWIVKQSK